MPFSTKLRLILSTELLQRVKCAAAASATAQERRLLTFHALAASQLNAVSLLLASWLCSWFFHPLLKSLQCSSTKASIGGMYLLLFCCLSQQFLPQVSWLHSSTPTMEPEEQSSDPHASLSSSLTPSSPFGISSTSNAGTRVRTLKWAKLTSTSSKPRNNTSSGPFYHLLLLMGSTLTSSVLYATTETPLERKRKLRKLLKRPKKENESPFDE